METAKEQRQGHCSSGLMYTDTSYVLVGIAQITLVMPVVSSTCTTQRDKYAPIFTPLFLRSGVGRGSLQSCLLMEKSNVTQNHVNYQRVCASREASFGCKLYSLK